MSGGSVMSGGGGKDPLAVGGADGATPQTEMDALLLGRTHVSIPLFILSY